MGPVHLIGHSLGGWAAAELATRNCTQLKSLTLIAPAGLRVKGVPMGDSFIWSPEELTRNLYHDQHLAEEILARPVTNEDADRQLTNRFMAARLGWQPRWFSLRLAQWLHRISVPTLLIWGREDRLIPSTYARAWENDIPHLRKYLLAGCGHVPYAEKPAETASAILEFLGSNT
jgi:pimeloyl-ACP methyl ester carboxylesterase